MKKAILLSFLFVMAISHSVYGQVKLDISTGINISNAEFKNSDLFSFPTDSRTGFFLGVSPSFPLNEKVNLNVDFQFSQKGFDGLDYSYLDIIPEIEFKVLPFLKLGVGLNYGIKVINEFRGLNLNGMAVDFDFIDSTDFGLTGKIKANYKKWFVFLRYNYGLKNILAEDFTDENGDPIEGIKLINKNFQIGVGNTFDLKKNMIEL